MHAPHVDPLNRRRATAALVALPWLWTGARAQPAVRHRLTPAQTKGPFYQVALPAEEPNPDGALLPGLFVRARLEQAQVQNAMLIPQQAVTRGSQGDSVMVVAQDGSVQPRPIKIEGAQGQNWIVTDGLKAGEQVMVEGAMKLMLGAKVVKPVPWQPKAATAHDQSAQAATKTEANASAAAPAAPAASAPAPAASN